MCFGNRDNSAAREAQAARLETERREQERRDNILAGQSSIEDAFSQFNDDYFSNFRNAFTGNYLPQLDEQFSDARGKMVASLADRGILNSSVGAGKVADLTKMYNDERTAIGNRAIDASNDHKAKIDASKTDLFGLNSSIADPSAIATRTTGALSAIQAPQSYSPLGQVFASALEPVIAYSRANANSPGRRYVSPTSGSSGRVVQ